MTLINSFDRKIIKIYLIVISVIFIHCNQSVASSPENELIIGEMTDVDGNTYKTIKIGKQIWMAENLRVTRYNNREKINQINEITTWGLDTTGAYCFYNNTENVDTIQMYGALYSYYVVASNKIAPPGWRVPSKEDWEELISFLISHKYNWDKSLGENKVGKALASQSDWDTLSRHGIIGNNLLENNSTGFCAYPGGRRLYRGTRTYTVPQEDNGFEHVGKECNWWASSGYVYSAPFYSLWYSGDKLIFGSTNGLSAGFSIRLIKTEMN